jgi:hypothetical protein
MKLKWNQDVLPGPTPMWRRLIQPLKMKLIFQLEQGKLLFFGLVCPCLLLIRAQEVDGQARLQG